MEEIPDGDATTGAGGRTGRYLRLHALAYALGVAGFVVINIVAASGWWLFWPLLIWGFLVFLHYMYVKTLRAGKDWAENRAGKIVGRAYDVSHIESIRDRSAAAGTAGRDNASEDDRADQEN